MYFVSSRRDQTLEISSTGGLKDVGFFFVLVISLFFIWTIFFKAQILTILVFLK